MKDTIEFNEVRQWTENSEKEKKIDQSLSNRLINLPKLWNRMDIIQHAVECVSVGEFRTPTMSIADEEHLFLVVLC